MQGLLVSHEGQNYVVLSGNDGKSAYTLWTEINGNENKTIDEFFDTLIGENGEKGDKGDTGNKGDKGDKGDKDDKGDTGAAGVSIATVTHGTTNTGAAGTNAIVTNSGTPTAAVFNFTIPRGNTGSTGASGSNGASAYVHIRWGTSATPSTLYTEPNDSTTYIGFCSSNSATAPTTYQSYKWHYNKGNKGDKGDTGATGAKGDKGDTGTGLINLNTGNNLYIWLGPSGSLPTVTNRNANTLYFTY
jgi:hypothetical protein